ncbi:MAG TPA: PAS domain-containing sensor histidine kinase, partial [Fervidobacterium sp.]|nr:PAS domain-containing sensor histidine kinase [Fervidobacterium sp.]
MLIGLLIFIALSAFFAIMYLIERKRRHTFSKYLDKIAVSIGEEAGTPPLYIYERLRKRIEELQNGILESEKER